MSMYLVFFGRRGVRSIVWEASENPLGVFTGDTPEEAMHKAAAVAGVMGAFFAVEGTFWGVTPDSTPTAFGTAETTDQRINRLIEAINTRLLESGD